MPRSRWKGPFVGTAFKRIKQQTLSDCWVRSTTIVPAMNGLYLKIHNGRLYIHIQVKRTMTGYKLGDFALTRKVRTKRK